MVSRTHLDAFLEVVDAGSIQAAARQSGRSRATYNRYLADLSALFNAPKLVERAPGQRYVALSPAGVVLEHRARAFLAQWDQWVAQTRDAIGTADRTLRVGAPAGAFDLLADVLVDLRSEDPTLPLSVIEIPGDELQDAVIGGIVDIGFGTQDPEGLLERLRFEAFGPLPWAVILPDSQASTLPETIRIADLDDLPLVVPRSGAARDNLEKHFVQHAATLFPIVEVESTSRIVEMVARGFGPAIVSRIRLAFLPPGVQIRLLVDGPRPLTAGVFTRKGRKRSARVRRLIDAARVRFRELTRTLATPMSA